LSSLDPLDPFLLYVTLNLFWMGGGEKEAIPTSLMYNCIYREYIGESLVLRSNEAWLIDRKVNECAVCIVFIILYMQEFKACVQLTTLIWFDSFFIIYQRHIRSIYTFRILWPTQWEIRWSLSSSWISTDHESWYSNFVTQTRDMLISFIIKSDYII
jgi:hypothetical protein